jgi:phage-related protein
MNTKWTILYYESANEECPVEEFINSKSAGNRIKIFNWMEQLERHGPNLPRPYADFLEDGIHELRIKLSGEQVRIIYFFCYHDFIILTHVFIKKTDQVPEAQIEKARKFRDDFISRYPEKKLREETK